MMSSTSSTFNIPTPSAQRGGLRDQRRNSHISLTRDKAVRKYAMYEKTSHENLMDPHLQLQRILQSRDFLIPSGKPVASTMRQIESSKNSYQPMPTSNKVSGPLAFHRCLTLMVPVPCVAAEPVQTVRDQWKGRQPPLREGKALRAEPHIA